MTRLLVDNQLPVALSRFLTAEGIESMHVMDVALDEASDHKIWEYARSQGYVVVTKDEDFLHLSIADQHGPQLVWVRLGNCRKTFLLDVFGRMLPGLRDALSSDQQVIEIRE